MTYSFSRFVYLCGRPLLALTLLTMYGFTRPHTHARISAAPKKSSKRVGKYPLKIIHAGLHRTGTASVAEALGMLGYKVWHMERASRNCSLLLRGTKFWTRNNCEVFRLLDRPDWEETVDFDQWLQAIDCDVIMDCPTILYFEQLLKKYPHCKVIVPIFGFEKWYSSMVALTQSIHAKSFSFVARFLCVHHMLQQEYWPRLLEGNVERFLHDKEWALAYYHRRLAHIKRVVPKKQLLIFDVRDGWEPLCTFLGKKVPTQPFPKVNARGQTTSKIDGSCLSIIIVSCLALVLLPLLAICTCIYLRNSA